MAQMRKPRLTRGAWLEVGKTQVGSRAWQMLEVGTWSWSERSQVSPTPVTGALQVLALLLSGCVAVGSLFSLSVLGVPDHQNTYDITCACVLPAKSLSCV